MMFSEEVREQILADAYNGASAAVGNVASVYIDGVGSVSTGREYRRVYRGKISWASIEYRLGKRHKVMISIQGGPVLVFEQDTASIHLTQPEKVISLRIGGFVEMHVTKVTVTTL